MRLSKLIKSVANTKIIYEGENWEREIGALSVDSRKTQRDSLFICLSGGKSDSHEFAREAIEKGAIAIVTERILAVEVPQVLVADAREALGVLASIFYEEPTSKIQVVGITGTNGKTTVSYMLEGIFREWGKKVGVIGTLGIRFEGREIPSDLTTPDPIELQSAFADMVKAGVEYAIMEVSAHALHYKKTAGVRFAVCIFTNFTQDHLDFFQTMQAYKRAKLSLFSAKVCPIAVLNGDDEVGREILAMRQEEGAKTVSYGLHTPVDAFAIITEENLYGSSCMLNVNDKLCRVNLSLSGRHNVYNALSAAACAMELGVRANTVASGLTRLKGVTGRLQRVANTARADVFVDFAHTPDGLAKSLDALKAHCQGRLICLFGCGGNRDRSKRPLMGEVAARRCDFSVLTSDNPRYEDPLDILSEVEKGYRRFSSRYVIVPDRRRAIEYALDFLRAGDVLLIAGKGGECTQEIMGIKYPFNDQTTVVELLKRKGKN